MKMRELIYRSFKAKKFLPLLVLGSISMQLPGSVSAHAQGIVTQSSTVCGTTANPRTIVTDYFYSEECRPSWAKWDISISPNTSVVQNPVSGLKRCGSKAPIGYLAAISVKSLSSNNNSCTRTCTCWSEELQDFVSCCC